MIMIMMLCICAYSSKQAFLYSNIRIQYISTNNPLARKQASSITSLHKQQRAYLMPWYKTPLLIQTLSPFQSLIISELTFNEAKLTSPSPTDYRYMKYNKKYKYPLLFAKKIWVSCKGTVTSYQVYHICIQIFESSKAMYASIVTLL